MFMCRESLNMYNFWFYCVLCTVMFHNIGTVAEDVQIINIEYNSSGKDVNIQRFLENQKYKIRLDGFPKKPYQMQCNHLYNIGQSLTFNIDFNGESGAAAIKQYMAGTWNCTIDTKKFQLKIHVLGVHWPITIISSKRMSYVMAHDTTSYVDGSADYVYSTGEIIAYSCRDTTIYGPPNRHWTMAYYDVNGIKQFESYPFPAGSKELSFISRMSSKHDGSYVECIYSEGNTSNSDKYIYRTHFKMSPIPRDTGPLVVHVNGIKLVPKEDQKDPNVRVEYNYIYKTGNNLSITCENTEKIKGKLQFYENNSGKNLYKARSMTPEKIVFNFTRLDTGPSDKILQYDFINEDSRSPILPSAEITMTPDTLVDRDVRILGLPEKNLEYQYSRGVHTWYMVYLYDAGETLDLTCLFTYEKYTYNAVEPPYLMWLIDEHYKNASNYRKDLTFKKIRYITGKFTLESDHDNSKIVCVTQEPTGRRQAVVVLRQKPTDNVTTGIVVAVCIVCASAVIIACVVIIICKRKKGRIQVTPNNETTATNDSNGSEIPMKVINTNKVPPIDHKEDNNVVYSQPFTHKDINTIKKQEVKLDKTKHKNKTDQHNENLTYANLTTNDNTEINYADLDLAYCRRTDSNLKKKDDPNYSDLMHLEEARKCNEYANVFENNVYVNSEEVFTRAEPTYKINKK